MANTTNLSSMVKAFNIEGEDVNLITLEGIAVVWEQIKTYFGTKGYIDEQINAKLSGLFHIKGAVATYDDLPTEGMETGDAYYVEDTGTIYFWSDDGKWHDLGHLVDLEGYATEEELDEVREIAKGAETIAQGAETIAKEAQTDASTAIETADNASTKADTANNTANSANEKATSALEVANNAKTQAENAENTANDASTTATNASTTATNASTTATEAKNAAGDAQTDATNALNQLDTMRVATEAEILEICTIDD